MYPLGKKVERDSLILQSASYKVLLMLQQAIKKGILFAEYDNITTKTKQKWRRSIGSVWCCE